MARPPGVLGACIWAWATHAAAIRAKVTRVRFISVLLILRLRREVNADPSWVLHHERSTSAEGPPAAILSPNSRLGLPAAAGRPTIAAMPLKSLVMAVVLSGWLIAAAAAFLIVAYAS